MARKRRAPSLPPPSPPPPQEDSSEESGSEEEEDEPHLAASQMPPRAAANNADEAEEEDGDEEDSESDNDAEAFQLRQVHRSPTKPPHPQSKSDADDEEEGNSSDSEPDNSEPVVQKKAAATPAAVKSKVEQERKRPASDPPSTIGKAKKAKAGTEKAVAVAEATPPSKGKKVKAEPEKAAPEATLPGKAKKGNAELEKAAPEATPSGKGKKAKTKQEKPAALADRKSDKPARTMWGKGDELKILEALAAYVMSEGVLPKFELLLTTVRDRLDRKNCTYTDIYEKVRRLKERYEKMVTTGIVPSKEDELQMYILSEAIWGEKAKEAIAAAAFQKDSAVTKSKKGQASKEKIDGNSVGGASKEAANSTANQNGDSQKGSKKGQAIKEKTDRDVKSSLSKEATTTATQSKSKKRGDHNVELDKDAKDGTLKDKTTGTQKDNDLAKSKRGKTDKAKMNSDADSRMPKETTTANQNGVTQIKHKEVDTNDEEAERDANVQGTCRSFDELCELYSNLAVYVEEIEAHHPCGETLKRLFQYIGDEKAEALESKIKKYRVSEAKVEKRRGDIQNEVLNLLLGLVA